LVVLLAPFAPHVTFSLWRQLCTFGNVAGIEWSGDASEIDVGQQRMPNARALRATLQQQSALEMDVVVHVDGRMCSTLRVSSEALSDESAALAICVSDERVRACVARALRRRGREHDAARVIDVDGTRGAIGRVVLRRQQAKALISLALSERER